MKPDGSWEHPWILSINWSEDGIPSNSKEASAPQFVMLNLVNAPQSLMLNLANAPQLLMLNLVNALQEWSPIDVIRAEHFNISISLNSSSSFSYDRKSIWKSFREDKPTKDKVVRNGIVWNGGRSFTAAVLEMEAF